MFPVKLIFTSATSPGLIYTSDVSLKTVAVGKVSSVTAELPKISVPEQPASDSVVIS